MLKATVNRKELIKAITRVKPVINQNSTLPAIRNIILETTVNNLIISGTNFDNSIITKVDCFSGNEAGSCLVDHKSLLEIVKSLSCDTIDLHTTGYSLGESLIISGISLPLQEIDAFPQIRRENILYTMYNINQDIKNKSLMACKFVSKELSRPALKGIYFEVLESETIITATNGHILTTNNILENNNFTHNFIVQPLPLLQAMKVKKEQINIDICETQAIFNVGNNYTIISKLIDGPYPDYKCVIPSEFDSIINVDKLSLITANKSLSACVNKVTNQVIFDFYKDTLILSAFDPDTAKSGKQEIESNTTTGENIKTSYNCKFLDLILNYINSDTVKMKITSIVGASIVHEKDNSDSLFLIMPLRIND